MMEGLPQTDDYDISLDLFDDKRFITYIEYAFQGDALTIVNSASLVRFLVPDVVIYGFSSSTNPEASYFSLPDTDIHSVHIFAVASDRFIVDPWMFSSYRNYPMTFNKSVFDLNDRSERAEIASIYGDRTKWRDVGSEVQPFQHAYPDVARRMKLFFQNKSCNYSN